MKVAVKLFAAARELAGSPELVIELSPGPTAGDVRRALASAAPRLEVLASRSLLAINANYVDDDHVVIDGDEVALIPPVSGG